MDTSGAKAKLYRYISDLRECLHIDSTVRGFSMVDMCRERFNVMVTEIPFVTPGLRGMAYPETRETQDLIILNSHRNKREQNFDCSHEFIHLLRHQVSGAQSFSCYEKVRPNQNPFYEWEANEGAAELIMPFRQVIPDFVKYFHEKEEESDKIRAEKASIAMLAGKYHVTPKMMEYRLANLKYELALYCAGCTMDTIVPLSKRQQLAQNVNMDRFDFSILIGNAYREPDEYYDDYDDYILDSYYNVE